MVGGKRHGVAQRGSEIGKRAGEAVEVADYQGVELFHRHLYDLRHLHQLHLLDHHRLARNLYLLDDFLDHRLARHFHHLDQFLDHRLARHLHHLDDFLDDRLARNAHLLDDFLDDRNLHLLDDFTHYRLARNFDDIRPTRGGEQRHCRK